MAEKKAVAYLDEGLVLGNEITIACIIIIGLGCRCTGQIKMHLRLVVEKETEN